MTKKLIINADDFGIDRDASDGIINLASKGKITSTTVMANLVNPDELDAIKKFSKISIGVHLNLLEGRPVSDLNLVKSITGDDGNFLSQKSLMILTMLGQVKYHELKTEIKNQLGVLEKAGIKISHADSHKHLHQHPFIGRMVLQIFRELGISKVRLCNPTDTSSIRMMVLKVFSKLTKSNLNGFKSPQALISSFSTSRTIDMTGFSRAIRCAFGLYDTVEVMTHPAFHNTSATYLNKSHEYKFWCDQNWKAIIDTEKIKLINYNEL